MAPERRRTARLSVRAADGAGFERVHFTPRARLHLVYLRPGGVGNQYFRLRSVWKHWLPTPLCPPCRHRRAWGLTPSDAVGHCRCGAYLFVRADCCAQGELRVLMQSRGARFMPRLGRDERGAESALA